jgi:hypothetical protein
MRVRPGFKGGDMSAHHCGMRRKASRQRGWNSKPIDASDYTHSILLRLDPDPRIPVVQIELSTGGIQDEQKTSARASGESVS